MNFQAEQPVASAIGPAQRVLTWPMSLFPSVRSRPVVSRRRVGLGGHGETVNQTVEHRHEPARLGISGRTEPSPGAGWMRGA